MPRHIVRMAKRRTAWESASTDELIQAEFLDRHGGLDLRPSVYVFEAHDVQAKHELVVRLRAEHAVSLMKSPNAAGPHVDFEGVTPRPPEFSEGTTRFSLANRVHHEVVLDDQAELHAMLSAARADLANRLLPVSRDEVLDYARARLAAEDPEWVAVLNEGSKPEWKKLVDKHWAAKAHPQ